MFLRACANGIHRCGDLLDEKVDGIPHLDCLRRIDDVRRGEAKVQPARRRTGLLGDRGGERNDVVLGRLFDLLDTRDIERRAGTQLTGSVGGDDAGLSHRVGRGKLHFEPRFVATLLAPDRPHLRVCVSPDH